MEILFKFTRENKIKIIFALVFVVVLLGTINLESTFEDILNTPGRIIFALGYVLLLIGFLFKTIDFIITKSWANALISTGVFLILFAMPILINEFVDVFKEYLKEFLTYLFE